MLTRGPVHEAFAETVTFDPEPGIVVPKAPPAAIEEVPPEQRPAGDNVTWIPGYWSWDDERNDFLWVSGIWRNLPPGRQWIAGYWGKTAQGYQWTSGYWADASMSNVAYLPEPPATVETGPNVAAPSPDDTWLPGCWVWQNNRYAWRPGFWANGQANWDWIPAHYVWAPRGYVFVDGYWDHSIDRRGMLFAPVYFNAGVYGQAGFSYTPTTVIDLAALTSHLFCGRSINSTTSATTTPPTTKPQGSTRRIRTTPGVSATTRFMLTTAGSTGGIAGGHSASRRTSKTAAFTRMPGRRAHLRPREQWRRVRCKQEGGTPWWLRNSTS